MKNLFVFLIFAVVALVPAKSFGQYELKDQKIIFTRNCQNDYLTWEEDISYIGGPVDSVWTMRAEGYFINTKTSAITKVIGTGQSYLYPNCPSTRKSYQLEKHWMSSTQGGFDPKTLYRFVMVITIGPKNYTITYDVPPNTCM